MERKNCKEAILLLVTMLIVVILGACNNKSNNTEAFEKDDFYNDKPLDSCITQGEINYWVSQQAIRHKDSVISAFHLFVEKFSTPLIEKELDLWKEYESLAIEVYKQVYMTGFCGSAANMGLSGIAYDIADQFLASFAYKGTNHMRIDDRWIDAAYLRFMNHGIEDDYRDDDPNNWYFTLEEKKQSLADEQAAWNRWIAYREKISSKIMGKEKRLYDMRTNELRRMKLIQLKNQYQWYGLNSDEWFENLLDPQCTDKELQKYTFFDSVWGEYQNTFYRGK